MADAGDSVVFDALAVGAGDITTWVGDIAMALSPYAEVLMLPLIGLASVDQFEITRRIQSPNKRNLIPDDEILSRRDWVRKVVSERRPRIEVVSGRQPGIDELLRTDTAETNVV